MLAVVGERGNARARVDEDVGQHLERRRIDDVRHARRLRRGGDDLVVGADRHAFGLDADLDLGKHLAIGALQHRDVAVVLVGDVDALALVVDVEQLGIGTGVHAADDFQRLGVDDVELVVVADANHDLLEVGRDGDAAWALAGGDGLDHLQRFGIEHRDRVVFLVGNENGVGRRRRADEQRQGKDNKKPSHHLLPFFGTALGIRHFVSGSSKPSVSVRYFGCRKPSCGEIDTSARGPASRIG